MNRRELIGLIACTTVGSPLAATAQQVDKPRRDSAAAFELRLRLRLNEFAAKHDLKQFGMIGVCKTKERVPSIFFAD
jgi:hypothetical protein